MRLFKSIESTASKTYDFRKSLYRFHCFLSYNIYVCTLLWAIQGSIFVTVNTTIQVNMITKDIYIIVDHIMFLPLLGRHQLYLCLLRC
jgi:hypothetical protein